MSLTNFKSLSQSPLEDFMLIATFLDQLRWTLTLYKQVFTHEDSEEWVVFECFGSDAVFKKKKQEKKQVLVIFHGGITCLEVSNQKHLKSKHLYLCLRLLFWDVTTEFYLQPIFLRRKKNLLWSRNIIVSRFHYRKMGISRTFLVCVSTLFGR